jgi:hypothetical protein
LVTKVRDSRFARVSDRRPRPEEFQLRPLDFAAGLYPLFRQASEAAI